MTVWAMLLVEVVHPALQDVNGENGACVRGNDATSALNASWFQVQSIIAKIAKRITF